MPLDYAALAAPFAPDEIEWRVGSTTKDKTKGMALAYIDARVVMDRLDAVCTPPGWQDTYPHANEKTCCSIGILTENGWIWKSDGAGDTDFEGAKGAFSDAFKRAAVRWGIGRYLYDMKAPWVEIEQRGNTYIIKPSEMAKLNALAAKTVVTDDSGNPISRNGKVSKDPDWKGPLTKTEMSEEMKHFFAKVGECGDIETLEQVLDEYAAIIAQCKVDMRGWWDGKGEPRMPNEFVPAETRIEAKRNFLKNQMNGAAA